MPLNDKIDTTVQDPNQQQQQADDGDEKVNYQKIVDSKVAQKPWLDQLNSDKSTAEKLISSAKNNFDKRQKTLLSMFSALQNAEKEYNSIIELPMIDNDPVVLFAIIVQNAMHPKNSQRVDAVAQDNYVEIRTRACADKFLGDLLKKHLTNELSGVESEVVAQFKSLDTEEDVKLILEAPDAYYGAAVLTSQPFFIGKGDRTTFLKVVLNSNPKTIKDLGKKIGMLTKSKIGSFSVYNDKLCNPERLNKQTIYRLWLHCRRRHQAVTLEELIEAYPY